MEFLRQQSSNLDFEYKLTPSDFFKRRRNLGLFDIVLNYLNFTDQLNIITLNRNTNHLINVKHVSKNYNTQIYYSHSYTYNLT